MAAGGHEREDSAQADAGPARRTVVGLRGRLRARVQAGFHPPHFWQASSFFCLGLNGLVFGYVLTADPALYAALTLEDSLVEWLSAVWLLLAALALLAAARRERSARLRRAWLLGGAAMLFGAGEELSWGQRIFGFATPEFLLGLNQQNELTLHNLNNRGIASLHWDGVTLLCLVTCAAYFYGKRTLFGVPLPSVPLLSGFIIARANHAWMDITYPPDIFLSVEKGLIVLLFVYALMAGRRQLLIVAAAAAALVLALDYASYQAQARIHGYEVSEYLFGMGCLFWSLEILRARGGLRAVVGWRSLKGMRAGALALMAGSLGLVLFAGNSNARREAAAIQTVARASLAGALVGQSRFEVYHDEGQLLYFRGVCRPIDVVARFFLHVIPVNEEDLPDERREYGFDNLDFDIDEHSALVEAPCIAIVPLPEYGIARIRTGQYSPSWGRLWEVSFAAGEGLRYLPR